MRCKFVLVSFGKLILDGINWFPDGDERIAIIDWDYKREKYPTVHMPPFLSNRIMQLRYFDDGRKFNHIFVTIEVTGEDGILNSTPIIQKLESYLGKADKVTLNKVFKGTRFERIKGQPNWFHLYSYIDDNGFKYDAYTQKISYTNEFRCWIEISGFNFKVRYEHKGYIVDKEGESSEILKVFVRFCDKLVDEYSEELKRDFGVTPEWYR